MDYLELTELGCETEDYYEYECAILCNPKKTKTTRAFRFIVE